MQSQENKKALKVLQSDKLSGDGQIFQVGQYLYSLITIKLAFFQQEHLQIFPTPLTKLKVRFPKKGT